MVHFFMHHPVCMCVKKVKSTVRGFIQHIVVKHLKCATTSRKSVLISTSQPYSQASANTARPCDMGWCIMQSACLLPKLMLGTHSNLGRLRLSRPGCLVVYLSKDGHPPRH